MSEQTDTFDWAGLWSEAADIRYDHGDPAAAAYLRERIEAAFVPLHRYETVYAVAAEQGLRCTEATARAEAAEARVKVLEEALRKYMAATPEHDFSCGVGPIYRCTCDLHDANEAARQALGAEHGK